MTLDIANKLKAAGCNHVTFGIESGSQRVLNLMNKRYLITDANNVLKNMHEAGIMVTCNFMFGFPGETEEDFKQTLNFIELNKNYITYAYPSRTYCTIEQNSYMASNLEEFGIQDKYSHGQYWESKDKKNTFLVRINRCLDFTAYAKKVGVTVTAGFSNIELDRMLNTAIYYKDIGKYKESLEFYKKALELDPKSAFILKEIQFVENKIKQ